MDIFERAQEIVNEIPLKLGYQRGKIVKRIYQNIDGFAPSVLLVYEDTTTDIISGKFAFDIIGDKSLYKIYHPDCDTRQVLNGLTKALNKQTKENLELKETIKKLQE